MANLKGFGLGDDSPEVAAAGRAPGVPRGDLPARSLPHPHPRRATAERTFVGLDEATQRNLELLANLQDGSRRYTLLEVLDQTRTSPGARALRRRLLTPLKDACRNRDAPRRRGVASTATRSLLARLREALGGVLDLERLAARLAMERANAKDLLAVRSHRWRRSGPSRGCCPPHGGTRGAGRAAGRQGCGRLPPRCELLDRGDQRGAVHPAHRGRPDQAGLRRGAGPAARAEERRPGGAGRLPAGGAGDDRASPRSSCATTGSSGTSSRSRSRTSPWCPRTSSAASPSWAGSATRRTGSRTWRARSTTPPSGSSRSSARSSSRCATG